MKNLLNKISKLRQKNRGDTIVEVMISMAILALVLGLAYATSNRSLNNSVDVNNRYQALAYAQEQIEYLKNAANKGSSALSPYQNPALQPFCAPTALGAPIAASDPICGNYRCPPPSANCTPNKVSVTYNDATKIFTVNTTWDSNNPSEPGSVTLYYKPPQDASAFPPPPPPPPAPSPSPPPSPPAAAGCVPKPPFTVTLEEGLGSGSSGTATTHVENIAPPLATGCNKTEITIRTIDEDHAAGYQPTQTNERMFIEGHTGASPVPVFTTALTNDIPEADPFVDSGPFEVSVTAPVNQLFLKHCALWPYSPAIVADCTSSVNSIHRIRVTITQTP